MGQWGQQVICTFVIWRHVEGANAPSGEEWCWFDPAFKRGWLANQIQIHRASGQGDAWSKYWILPRCRFALEYSVVLKHNIVHGGYVSSVRPPVYQGVLCVSQYVSRYRRFVLWRVLIYSCFRYAIEMIERAIRQEENCRNTVATQIAERLSAFTCISVAKTPKGRCVNTNCRTLQSALLRSKCRVRTPVQRRASFTPGVPRLRLRRQRTGTGEGRKWCPSVARC